MPNEHSDFWIQLLKFGETEEERRRNWNVFCIKVLNVFSYPFIAPDNKENVQEKTDVGIVQSETRVPLQRLANRLNGPSTFPDKIGPDLSSFMDFYDIDFDDNVSFSGRVLIGANFQNTIFSQNANFSDVNFLGLTHFNGTKFLSPKVGLRDGAHFRNCTFHNTVYFDSAEFDFRARFDNARFQSASYFRGTRFEPRDNRPKASSGFVSFVDCQFSNEVSFENAKFAFGVDFSDVKFKDAVKFERATVHHVVSFNNAKFSNTTSFRKIHFGRPPKFFETDLHEDTDFGDIDWKSAEHCYRRKTCEGENPTVIKTNADDAVRAWDRLALIMSKREKLVERHEFFRLKMRAQRKRDGRCLLTFLNWLFDITSDYGWSVGRAFVCWLGHMGAGALALVSNTLICSMSLDRDEIRVLWDSLLVSFANAHAILGLASEGGYLHGARQSLYSISQQDSILNAIGTCQIIFGPIFLFLVLLTLRNRFRIG